MELSTRNPVKLINGYLVFKPEKKTTNYGLTFNYQIAKLKISMELKINFLAITNQTYAHYIINRSNLHINNDIPNTILYEMAHQMVNAIYPVAFYINQDMDCISINNHPEIMERCKVAEQKIAHYYLGNITQKMLTNFKENYSSPENLILKLKTDLPFSLLFYPIYKSYLGYTQNNNYTLTIQEKIINFDLEHQLEQDYNQDGKLVIHIKTIKSNLEKANFSATYYLHPEKHTIAMITGTVVYPENDALETLTFECYELD